MRIPGPNHGRVLQQGFKMCTAKGDVAFYSLCLQFPEEKQSRTS